MNKNLLLVLFAFFAVLAGAQAASAGKNAIVKMKTNAPEGTALRFQTTPYEFEVSGATKGVFYGEYFSKGAGTEITITCEDLSILEVYGSQLTELSFEDAPLLSIVRCYDNEIASVDFSGCPALEVLECKNNKLTSLDLTKNPIMETVDVASNKVTDLKLGTQPMLRTLRCGSNPLASLDVAECPVLEEIYFENCGLPTVDLSKNPKVWWIYAFGNNMNGASMTTFINNIPEPAGTGMIYIVDTDNKEESNVCLMDDVRAFAMKGWATFDYLGGLSTDTQLGKFYPGADYEPSVSERAIKLTTSRSAGEKITLYIKASDNIAITGVEEEAVAGQKLSYTLTGSEVEIKGDVTSFECPDNDITSLSFEGDLLITYLECQNNKIETLDLSGASKLQTAYVHSNNLKSLSVQGCRSLLRLDCYKNNLKGKAMKAFVNSLPESTNSPYLFIIDTKAAEGTEHNIATTTDVEIAIDKGWKLFDYVNGDRWGMGVAYEGSEPTEPDTPDEYFTLSLTTKDYVMFTVKFADKDYQPVVDGAEISGWNGEALMLNVQDDLVTVYGDVVDLQILFSVVKTIDVTKLPNLVNFNVALNDITELDLSGNPKLESVSCECNLIEALDFSKCPLISYINCYGNRIEGEKMTAMMQSLPQRTREDYGTLIVRDASYQYENNVCLKSDVAMARAKYWAVCELSDEDDELHNYDGEDPAGISDVMTDADETPAVYYNLQGHKIENPANGVYIERKGNKVSKVIR